MEVKVLERAQNELKLEIVGEGHTFCNALQDVLLKDEAVEFAGYTVPHPLINSAVFRVQTKEGQNPIEALKRAAVKLKETAAAFRQSFEEATKQA
ncbi:MAG: DNA-directed RNA polymerase subunit L [Candidatus Bathyarchaeia archaeon]